MQLLNSFGQLHTVPPLSLPALHMPRSTLTWHVTLSRAQGTCDPVLGHVRTTAGRASCGEMKGLGGKRSSMIMILVAKMFNHIIICELF